MAAGTPATVTRPRGWLWWPHAMRAHGHEVGTRLHAAPCPAGPEEGDILGTSWGHPEDILGTSISFCCWLRCSRASPQAVLARIQRRRCHPPSPISPKCPQEKVPKGSPRCHQQRDTALTRWAVGDVHSVFSWDALPGLGQRLGLGTRRP